MISPAHSKKPKVRSKQCPQRWWYFNDTAVSVFPDKTFYLGKCYTLGQDPHLTHPRTTYTESMLQESTSPTEKQWHPVDICLPFDISTSPPTIYLCQRFCKTKHFKDNRLKWNGTLPADNSCHEFIFYTPKQANSWMHLMFWHLLGSQMPLSVTVLPRTNIHKTGPDNTEGWVKW